MSKTRPDILEIIQETKERKINFIYLPKAGLTEFPKEILELYWLEKIDLRSNKLKTIPDSISALKNLKEINVIGNPLKQIPNVFGLMLDYDFFLENKERIAKENVVGIKFVNYALFPLERESEEFSEFINLTYLKLSGMRELPNRMERLINLTFLDLSNNDLSSLPDDIFKIKGLTGLDLSNNELRILPENIFNLTKLSILDLSNNKLDILPDCFDKLVNLKRLYLSENRLIEIPSSLSKMKKLSSLYLNYNRLIRIPHWITKLSKLRELLLSDNQLTELPENIGELSNLFFLTFDDNPIIKLPKTIVNFSDKINIFFPETLKYPPYEIAEQGIPAIRKYFEDLESQGEEFIYEAKLVIVGEPWAGKSTLAAKLLNPDAELTPYTDETMTRGIDILQWKFPFADNIEFTANIWDFAGQEILQSTHRYFLTKRTLYAIVIDTRPERDVLYDWLQNLKHFADHPPVVLILNERDDHRIEIPDSILNAFPFIKKPIYCVNFKTKRGLDDLIKGIQTELKTLPHIGKEPIPKNWVKLKTELEKITTDTIAVEDYFSLCAQIGNYSEEDARRISHFLHDLGYILHFQKDISLDNTVILNKQWATKAVYLVLDEKNKEKSERFTVSDIRRIWKDYDKNRYSDLIQLMKNFLICYELNNQEYILPQLLSVNPPENYKWEYTDNLFFEFSYPDFMPKGLLPRFIVKIHKYIYNGIQWKAGVQLFYQNSFAEVVEDYPKRRIKIRIAGKEKVEFLSIIRKEMEELHSFYLNLLVEPMIPCKCDGCIISNEPHLFKYSELKEYKKEKIVKIRCGKHVKLEIEVIDLLEGYEKETKENHFDYPVDKDRNVPGLYFEKILEGLLKRVYHNASIEPNFKLKDQNGKEFEYDFLVTSSELREIIVVEAKGYHDQKKIPLGSDSEKETIEWFFQKTFRNIKDNYPNPQNYQIRACYITSGYFTDDANAKLEEYNKTKFKSNAINVYYDRDKLFQLLKEKGLDKDIKSIKTHFRKPS